MEDPKQELIERYFQNALSARERTGFERRRLEDADFAELVKLHGLALEAIRMEGEAKLRTRLAAKGRALDAQASRPVVRKTWLWALPVMALGALAIWWFTRPPSPAELAPLAPAPVAHSPQIQDTIPAITPLVADDAKNEPAQLRQEEQQLFAAWFKPYKEESLEPAVRGEGVATPEEIFYQLYWDAKYAQALAAFEKMEPESQNKGDLRFLKANCLLATGKTLSAIALLQNTGRTRFQPEAEWLLALAYLKNGQRDKAAAQFGVVAANESSPRREAARQILEEMN